MSEIDKDNVTMRLRVPPDLQALVTTKFSAARESKNLIFSDTQLSIVRNGGGIPFQVRYCPTLSKKPKSDKADSTPKPQSSSQGATKATHEQPKKKFDPFENPEQALLITRLPTSTSSTSTNNSHAYTHNLVLNKFPIIPRHFILATKENKPQTDLLEVEDLELTYKCLQAWQGEIFTQATSRIEGASDRDTDNKTENKTIKGGKSLFAFFNSGEHSGASQVHRHLQLLPIEDMASTDSSPSTSHSHESNNTQWNVLCNEMTTPYHRNLAGDFSDVCYNPKLDCIHFSTRLTHSLSGQDIYEKYLLLMQCAAAAVDVTSARQLRDVGSNTDGVRITPDLHSLDVDSATISDSDGQTTLSYNLAMTSDWMAILPRKSETARLSATTHQDSEVNINGTILAGTMMVKEEKEWDAMRSDESMTLLDAILNQIAFRWPTCTKASEDQERNNGMSDKRNGGRL